MATENILMHCVKNKGLDRQTLHEHIRQHSVRAAEQVKLYGGENDLIERIRADEAFDLTDSELNALLDPASFTGMAERQCERFLEEEIRPLLEANRAALGIDAEINV